MGVQFERCVLVSTIRDGISVNVKSQSNNFPLPYPLLAITSLTDNGTATKVQVPYLDNTGYKTVWTPTGQQGWTVDLQCTLMILDDLTQSGADNNNPIWSWQQLDTGCILWVNSNQTVRSSNTQYGHSSSARPISKLPTGSYWYIDKIMISSRPGYTTIADMQITLISCWGT